MHQSSNDSADFEAILGRLSADLVQSSCLDELKAVWQTYLGKKGAIKLMMGGIGKISSPDERKAFAGRVQQLQNEATRLFEDRERELTAKRSEAALREQAEPLNLGCAKIGHLHPMTQTIREMNKLFRSMGFSIVDGPEIETDEFCFKRLNVPQNHPARDMQDTIYIEEPSVLLRTQTSSIESRTLAGKRPPLKCVSPGRVYRNENVNKSNHFIFHHYQGVVVMEHVTMKDLFSTFSTLFRGMYGDGVVVRYRNKYYPEVEPGVGPDMQCFKCQGSGCALCKGVGWIEMGGAGIIHPNVMRMAGLDPGKWRGFAFGLGLDRWVMAKYGIADIRTLLGGNLGYRYYANESALQ